MPDSNEKTQILFMNLVMTFQMAAWQQLGKIKSPLTDKIERDLDQARFSIDMLEMVRTKTSGNLSESEKRMLDHTISELQMNYVDEFEKEKKEKEKKEGEKAEFKDNDQQKGQETAKQENRTDTGKSEKRQQDD